MPLDMHAVSSSGSASIATIGTILLGGDNATTAGLPVVDKAVLSYWGGLTTIADTIKEIKLSSLDQIDSGQNGEDYVFGASSLLGMFVKQTSLPYASGARNIQMSQNTGAANNIGFTIDWSNSTSVKMQPIAGDYTPPNQICPANITFGGALTAITWGNKALAPTIPLLNGRYAILGAYVNALTNYALLRFVHTDFGNTTPGFPVYDCINTAVANAVLPKNNFMTYNGFQFVRMGEEIGQPCCPVFRVTNQSTGLTLQMASITADTPIVHLNLAWLGD